MEEQNKPQSVDFNGGSHVVMAGMLTGVAIAVGVPWMLLQYGQMLGQTWVIILVVLSLLGGGLIALTATFFGLIMPKHVGRPHVNLELKTGRSRGQEGKKK